MATNVTFVDYAAIEPRPWKNGRGITRNLFDDADAADRWTWRVSIAEITGSQPYSSYPGIRRGQVALGPGPVDLTINGGTTRLDPEGIVTFDGEDDVAALPAEEGFLDLNVMTRRDAWTADLQITEEGSAGAGDDEVVVLVALDDGCTVDGRTQRRLDAAQVLPGSSSTIGGRFLQARLRPVRL